MCELYLMLKLISQILDFFTQYITLLSIKLAYLLLKFANPIEVKFGIFQTSDMQDNYTFKKRFQKLLSIEEQHEAFKVVIEKVQPSPIFQEDREKLMVTNY